MLRKLRRLRVTAVFYTCGGLCAILLLVNFNEDVKKLLQQSPEALNAPHLNTLRPSRHHKEETTQSSSNLQEDVIRSLNKKVNGEQKKEEEEGDETREDGSYYYSSQPPPITTPPEEKAWYMWGGSKYPMSSKGGGKELKLFYEENLNNDRILEQLMYWTEDPLNGNNNGSLPPFFPESGDLREKEVGIGELIAISTGSIQVPRGGGERGQALSEGSRRGKLKTILLYYGLGMSWGAHMAPGRSIFLTQKCPVNSCRLSGNRAHIAKADVVLFKDVFMNPKIRRDPLQLWIMYMLECPLNTQNFIDKNVFNLTATYRHDSDIVTPYEKWVYHDDNLKMVKQGVDYSLGKTKKVAWFVSNCVAKNNRLDYARELSKYIEVDIYGACGTHSCSRANAKQCFDLLAKNYKFYLAFENSNCRDYISEKFFVNGLGNNVLPIVMGAHPDDYKRVAPYKSYIHVDDFPSPKELAEYLYLLDKNDDLYNEYFEWKGTGEFINTHFFCRLCAMAHYSGGQGKARRHYKDFNKWWRGPNVCTRRSWRDQVDIFSPQFYERSTTSDY